MRLIFSIFFSFLLVWFGGYLWYINKLTSGELTVNEKTDAIVVLTGGQNRLNVAIKLLEDGLAEKLYISGVDEKVTRAELLNLLGSKKELEECCIESGNQAEDTVGNAIETLKWLENNNIKTLRVVTSLEHMPRAMIEFKRFIPKIKFIEHPVGSWRPENINYFSLSQEYSKYIISLLRAKALDQLYNKITSS
ncbi:YdcF family protein [Emcibacteraceae bacterium]|nr:YdcF family protein [Emcibacteraceae bacterium]